MNWRSTTRAVAVRLAWSGTTGSSSGPRDWDFSIEIDGEGWVARRSRVESWDRNIGYLRTTSPADADEFSGHFLVELATCENVESGKALEWPPAPATMPSI
jgi:hypothetical protein